MTSTIGQSQQYGTDIAVPAATRNENQPLLTGKKPLVFEHTVTSAAGTGRSLPTLLLSKPVLGMIAGYIVLSTSAAGFLFSRQLSLFPGLQDKIQELETHVTELELQVDRLSSEIDNLETQNDRYESLNNDLNITVGELQQVNFDLKASNVVYESLNHQLNASNQQLIRLNGELQVKVDDFTQQNKILNQTVQKMSLQIARFESQNLELSTQNEILQNTTQILQNELVELTNTGRQLNATVSLLKEEVDRQEFENDRLESMNQNLTVVAIFLNDTASHIDQSFEAIQTYLVREIKIRQTLLLMTLENTYEQRLLSWKCDFWDYFRGEPFVIDTKIPIGSDRIPQVLDYVNQRVLSDLCLDVNDFQQQVTTDTTSTDQLLSAVQRYVGAALQYYFSNDNNKPTRSTNLSLDEWQEADFSCDNLTNDQRFFINKI